MTVGSTPGRGDLVSVIEAAYRLDGDDGTWLARLVDRAARAGLDRGLGTCGMFYVLDGERVRVSSPVARGTPGGAVDALRMLEAEVSSDITYRFIKDATAAVGGRATCATMSSRLQMGKQMRELDVHQRFLAPLGIVDFMSVAATGALRCGLPRWGSASRSEWRSSSRSGRLESRSGAHGRRHAPPARAPHQQPRGQRRHPHARRPRRARGRLDRRVARGAQRGGQVDATRARELAPPRPAWRSRSVEGARLGPLDAPLSLRP